MRTQVILGTKSVKTKKTEPCSALSAVFQCSYAFQIPAKHMDTCCLKFSVIQIDAHFRESMLGEITIGPIMYAHGTGVDHWKQMLANSRKSVEMWHKLVLAQ